MSLAVSGARVSWVARSGVAARGSSEAALLSEDESECIDAERWRLRRVEPASRSTGLDDGEATGEGKLIGVGDNLNLVTVTSAPCPSSVSRPPVHAPAVAHFTSQALSQRTRVPRPRRPARSRPPQPPPRPRPRTQRSVPHLLSPRAHVPQSCISPAPTPPRSPSSAAAAQAMSPPTLHSSVRAPALCPPQSPIRLPGQGILSGRIP